MQYFPFPKYVGLQEHMSDPTVLLQSALTSQSCDPSAHSSASVKQRKRSAMGDLWTKIFHGDPKGLNESLRLSSEVCRRFSDVPTLDNFNSALFKHSFSYRND